MVRQVHPGIKSTVSKSTDIKSNFIKSTVIKSAVILLLSAAVALSQSSEFTLRVDVPLVGLDVSVTDAEGRPVEGLTISDFEILEDGVRQDIQYFGSSEAPYHAFVLLDVSGSTQHKWTFMRRAVVSFAATLKPLDQLVVGVFGEDLFSLIGCEEV
jgi:hypothetical protein